MAIIIRASIYDKVPPPPGVQQAPTQPPVAAPQLAPAPAIAPPAPPAPAPIPPPAQPDTVMGLPVGQPEEDATEIAPEAVEEPLQPHPSKMPVKPFVEPPPLTPDQKLDLISREFLDDFAKHLGVDPSMLQPGSLRMQNKSTQEILKMMGPKQNELLERAMDVQMHDESGKPMVSSKGKPITLSDYVAMELKRQGKDPSDSYGLILDSIRMSKGDVLGRIKSRLWNMRKENPSGNPAWDKQRTMRSKDMFSKYLADDPGAGTPKIIERYLNDKYGPLEERQARADQWNEAYRRLAKVEGIAEYSRPTEIKIRDYGVDPQKRKYDNPRVKELEDAYKNERNPAKKRDIKQELDKAIGPSIKTSYFSFQHMRDMFVSFLKKHGPEKSKEALGIDLNDLLSPNGKNYLNKEVVYPKETSLVKDLERAREQVGKETKQKGNQNPRLRNKVDLDDTENEQFNRYDSDESGDDDDEDSEASSARRTVVAEVADMLYDPEDDALLHKVASLLSGLSLSSDPEVVSRNVVAMVSWYDENKSLFPPAGQEAAFRDAVRRVLADCADAFAGVPSLEGERNKVRTARIVLTARLERRS